MPHWFVTALLRELPHHLPAELVEGQTLEDAVATAMLAAVQHLEGEFAAAAAIVREQFPVSSAARSAALNRRKPAAK